MNDSINLVSPKNEQLEKEQNRLRVARILAFATMAFVVAIAILVFVVNLTLPINSIKQNEQTTLTNIAVLHKKLTQYYLVEDRANHLANIIAQRKIIPDIAGDLLTVIPQDLAISSMQIDAAKVSLIVSGASLLSMNKLIDDVTMLQEQKNIINNIVMQQLSLDVKSGQYSVSIQADIK
jgi:hypothetical protein